MEPTPLSSPLLFEGLTNHLRRLGFSVGVDHHLRLQLLLSHIYGQCSPEDLKSMICPLFAVNEKQQEAFYSAFDSFLPLLYSQTHVPAASEALIGQRNREEARPHRLTQAKWPYFTAAMAMLALLIGIAEWKSQIGSHPVGPGAQARIPAPAVDIPAPPTKSLRPPKVADGKVVRQEEPPETAATRPEPRKSFETQPKDRAGPSAKLLVLELLEWVESLVARFPFDVATVIVIFGPILFFLGYEWYRVGHRRLILHKQAGRKPPHSWPIRVKGRAGLVYDSPEFSAAARRLHSRQAGESYHLDLRRSVQATSGLLGYPSPQYRPDTRFSEYLILIDRTSPHDHQAAMFKQLADALHGQGLYVQQYFFDGDPRVCRSPEANTPIRLSDLQSKYGGHRVLLIGDADRLTNPVTGRLEDWAHAFSAWADRAILTPLPVSSWGARERTLAGQFMILPATTEALVALVGFFGGSDPGETRYETIHVAGDGYSDAPPFEPIERLRNALGPDLFSWLCASAIYPELHWDLTLYLASLPSMPEDLVTEANLLRLISLPWFRTGVIPDEIRYGLIQQLNSEQEREVRQAIVELLDQNPADEDTFASEAQSLQIALNRDLLKRWKKQRVAMRELHRHLSTNYSVGDYVVVRSLESVQTSALDFLLPGHLRRVFYERGLSVFGLRTVARLAMTVAVVVIGVGAVSSWRFIQIRRRTQERLPAPAVFEYAVSFESNVPGATYLIDGNLPPSLLFRIPAGVYTVERSPSKTDITGIRPAEPWRLPPGAHTVEAFLPGYKPATQSFTLSPGVTKPLVVSFQLEPELVRLRLASDLKSGKVSLDGQPPVDLQEGNFLNEAVALSADHTFSLIQEGKESLVFSFRAEPGGMVTITRPIKAKDVNAAVISNLAARARVYVSDGSLKAGVKDQTPQPIPADGLEFGEITPSTEIRLDDGKSPRPLPLEVGNAPMLTISLVSDPNQGTIPVEARVPGTEVSVDGRKPRLLRPERNYLGLEPGSHILRFSKEGYEAADRKVDLKKGEILPVVDVELKPVVRTATLAIEGATRDAEVLIDGTSQGVVGGDGSIRLDNVSPGGHNITLRKADFEDKQLSKEFTVGQTVRISGAEGQLTPFGTIDFRILPRTANVTYKRVDEAQTHPAENGKALPARPGRYVVTATANGHQPRGETVTVDSGKPLIVEWSLVAAEEPKKASPAPPKQTGARDYSQDPAAWTQDGTWWVHKGLDVGWLSNNQGVYLIEFRRQTTKGAFEKTRHVDWVIDERDPGNRIDYSFDFGNLERRATVGGISERKATKVKVPPAAASGDSYALQIEIGPDRVVIKDAQSRVLDQYERPNRTEPLGRFGFKGEVALRIINTAEYIIASVTNDKNNAFRELRKRIINTLRKYPFQPKSPEDANLDELAGVFAPVDGAIWRFCDESLSELAVKDGSQWKLKDPTKKPQVTQEMLSFLNHAQAITDAFFPAGATQPRLSYTLRPNLDSAFGDSKFELEIDGTRHVWESALQKNFTWPPPPNTVNQGALARIRGKFSYAFANRGGLWGIFRVMGDAEPRALLGKTVEWKYSQVGDGRKDLIEPAPVRLEIVQFPGGMDVFNPKFWEGLQLPITAVR